MESQKENPPKFRPDPTLKLLDQVREVLRYHHYAYRTEQTYCQWILGYIQFFGSKTHPNRLGVTDIEQYLSHLATEGVDVLIHSTTSPEGPGFSLSASP